MPKQAASKGKLAEVALADACLASGDFHALQAWAQAQEAGLEAEAALALGQGLAAWQRFDHLGAWEALGAHQDRWPALVAFLGRLLRLRAQHDVGLKLPEAVAQGPLHGFELAEDFLLSAERAAAQGAWDEAALRWSRAIAWLAARQYRKRFGVDLQDAEPSRLPEPVRARLAPRERQLAPLKALLLLEHAGEDPLWPVVAHHREALTAAWATAQRGFLAHGLKPLGEEAAKPALAAVAAFVREALPRLGEGPSSDWAVAFPKALGADGSPPPAPEAALAAAKAVGPPPKGPAPLAFGTRPLPFQRAAGPTGAPPVVEGPPLLPELEAWLAERQGRVRHRRVPEHLQGVLARMAEAPRAFTQFSRAVAAFYATEQQAHVELPLDPGPNGQRVREAVQALAQARKARILDHNDHLMRFALPRTGDLKHDLAHWRAVYLQSVLAEHLGPEAVAAGPHIPPPRAVYGTGAVLAWAKGGPLWVTPFPGGRDHFDHLTRTERSLSLPGERVVAIALDPADVPSGPTSSPVWAVGDVALRLSLLKTAPPA